MALAGLAVAAAAAGCGGTRQDADEPSGTYPVQVTRATFPEHQHLAQHARLVIQVKNTGSRAIPNVAVTVRSFDTRLKRTDVADPRRPVWIVDRGPAGGETAYTDTWALGRLAPGRTATFRWRVTAVRAGRHRIDYRVAAGLDGKAKARLPGGGIPSGQLAVSVTGRPGTACVDANGHVVRNPRPTHDNTCTA